MPPISYWHPVIIRYLKNQANILNTYHPLPRVKNSNNNLHPSIPAHCYNYSNNTNDFPWRNLPLYQSKSSYLPISSITLHSKPTCINILRIHIFLQIRTFHLTTAYQHSPFHLVFLFLLPSYQTFSLSYPISFPLPLILILSFPIVFPHNFLLNLSQWFLLYFLLYIGMDEDSKEKEAEEHNKAGNCTF